MMERWDSYVHHGDVRKLGDRTTMVLQQSHLMVLAISWWNTLPVMKPEEHTNIHKETLYSK